MTRNVIVIVGGGIIGVCTAYYLTKHELYSKSKYRIILIESVGVACAASGKAGGLLARDWHQESTASLAELSFDLHESLAKEYDGKQNWGYRRLKAISVETHSRLKKPKARLPPGCDWIDEHIIKDVEVLGLEENTAQCHPYHFTRFLAQKAQASGVEIVIGHVINVEKNRVEYVCNENTIILEADDILVCAGPWTSKILPKVLISGLKANSILIKTDTPCSPFAVFTDMTMGHFRGTPEFYSRPDEVYVCGETKSEPIPFDAKEVFPDHAKCSRLKQFADHISPQLKRGKVSCEQACFLPVSHSSDPVIGKVSDGIYVASGHSCWGICLGPGTGKVMSELLLDGQIKSANIERLQPSFNMNV